LYQGALARAAEDRGSVRLPLGGERVTGVLLEIDEGDNAPLTLNAAWAIVKTPRIVFKAAAGRYAVLSGNPAALPPRYDLALLRHQVLAYSAIEVKVGPPLANPGVRRPMAEYFRQAPPTAVLWVTIVAAVVVLVGLTVRILRRAVPDQQGP
jgi:hypothetical protein